MVRENPSICAHKAEPLTLEVPSLENYIGVWWWVDLYVLKDFLLVEVFDLLLAT